MSVPLPASTSPLWVAAEVFAAWRITAFICYEAGPFDVATRLRRALAESGLVRLISCFHCIGAWVSLVLTLLVFGVHWLSLLLATAVAGAVSILERWLGASGNASISTTETD